MAWKDVCGEGAIDENDLEEFAVDGVTVLLARVGQDYFAYPPLCPHQEEPLRKGLCDGELITCFKHIWQWDLRTGAWCRGMLDALEHPELRELAWQQLPRIVDHIVLTDAGTHFQRLRAFFDYAELAPKA